MKTEKTPSSTNDFDRAVESPYKEKTRPELSETEPGTACRLEYGKLREKAEKPLAKRLSRLREYGVDTEAAAARFLGNTELYVKFLDRFSEDGGYQEVTRSLDMKDAATAAMHVQLFRGKANNLGLVMLNEPCEELAGALLSRDRTAIRQGADRLERMYQQVCRWLGSSGKSSEQET